MNLLILSDKWWSYYFDEYSFTLFLIIMLLIALLGASKSPYAIALKKWLTDCFPMIAKKWDGRERRK